MSSINSVHVEDIMRRKAIACLMVFIFLTASVYNMDPGQAIGSKTAFTGVVSDAKSGVVFNCYKLNVRASEWGRILGVISVGDSVVIKGSSQDKYWYKIDYNGQVGFVSHRFIQAGSASASSTPAASSGNAPTGTSANKQKGYTTASSLNIRQSPWGNILTTYNYGTDVIIVGKEGDWYKIQYNGGIAYAHSHYVQPGSAPAGTVGGTGGTPQATFTTGPLNKRILDAMKSLINERLNYPAACGMNRDGTKSSQPGNLGCAFAVSTALQRAGVQNAYSLGVDNLSSQLQRQPKPGFKRVATGSRQPGDIIIWNPSHIGVVAGGGRAVSNSSSISRVREHSDTYMSIRYVLRAPA